MRLRGSISNGTLKGKYTIRTTTLTNAHRGIAVPFGTLWEYL